MDYLSIRKYSFTNNQYNEEFCKLLEKIRDLKKLYKYIDNSEEWDKININELRAEHQSSLISSIENYKVEQKKYNVVGIRLIPKYNELGRKMIQDLFSIIGKILLKEDILKVFQKVIVIIKDEVKIQRLYIRLINDTFYRTEFFRILYDLISNFKDKNSILKKIRNLENDIEKEKKARKTIQELLMSCINSYEKNVYINHELNNTILYLLIYLAFLEDKIVNFQNFSPFPKLVDALSGPKKEFSIIELFKSSEINKHIYVMELKDLLKKDIITCSENKIFSDNIDKFIKKYNTLLPRKNFDKEFVSSKNKEFNDDFEKIIWSQIKDYTIKLKNRDFLLIFTILNHLGIKSFPYITEFILALKLYKDREDLEKKIIKKIFS